MCFIFIMFRFCINIFLKEDEIASIFGLSLCVTTGQTLIITGRTPQELFHKESLVWLLAFFSKINWRMPEWQTHIWRDWLKKKKNRVKTNKKRYCVGNGVRREKERSKSLKFLRADDFFFVFSSLTIFHIYCGGRSGAHLSLWICVNVNENTLLPTVV